MPTHITATLLKAVEVREKPYEIFDDVLTGFLARVQPSGSISFYFSYRASDGHRTRVRIGAYPATTAPNARKKAEKLKSEVVLGKDPQKEKKTEHQIRQRAKHDSLAGFVENKYKDWVLSHQRRGEETLALLKRQFEYLYPRRLTDITAWEMQKWRTKKLSDGLKRATVNRAVTTLKALLNRAVEWGVIESNPLQSITPLKLDSQGIVRYLTSDEETRLRDALDQRQQEIIAGRESGNKWRRVRGYVELPTLDASSADYLKPMVLLALNTGMRRGELFDLSWPDINFNRASLEVRGNIAKSENTRHIPLNSESLALLKEWYKGETSGPVFPSPVTAEKLTTVSKAWSQVRAAAGIVKFRFHDLRHTFASKLVMAGIDLYTVKELMGHATIQMTEKYAHLAPEHKAKAVEKLVPEKTIQAA